MLDEDYEVEETWYDLGADVVSTEEGTGVGHMVPGFGEKDYAVAQEEVGAPSPGQ